jgi:hypothetical protein
MRAMLRATLALAALGVLLAAVLLARKETYAARSRGGRGRGRLPSKPLLYDTEQNMTFTDAFAPAGPPAARSRR